MSDVIAPAAPAAPASAAATPPPVVTKPAEAEPTFELEIDGKKTSLTHTQARTELQKRAAADKRMQEATEKQKKLDALLKKFEEDPEAALKELGKDPAKTIAAHLERKAKEALMTPEQVEAARLKAERDEYKAKHEATEKEKLAAAQKEADARNSQAMEEQLVAVADKYNLDADPQVLEELCDVAIELLEYGVAPTADQVAQEYMRREKEHIEARDRKRLSKLEGKKLLEYLGNPTLEKIKAAFAQLDAESLKNIPAPVVKKKAEAPVARPRDEKGKYVNEQSFDRKFGL